MNEWMGESSAMNIRKRNGTRTDSTLSFRTKRQQTKYSYDTRTVHIKSKRRRQQQQRNWIAHSNLAIPFAFTHSLFDIYTTHIYIHHWVVVSRKQAKFHWKHEIENLCSFLIPLLNNKLWACVCVCVWTHGILCQTLFVCEWKTKIPLCGYLLFLQSISIHYLRTHTQARAQEHAYRLILINTNHQQYQNRKLECKIILYDMCVCVCAYFKWWTWKFTSPLPFKVCFELMQCTLTFYLKNNYANDLLFLFGCILQQQQQQNSINNSLCGGFFALCLGRPVGRSIGFFPIYNVYYICSIAILSESKIQIDIVVCTQQIHMIRFRFKLAGTMFLI